MAFAYPARIALISLQCFTPRMSPPETVTMLGHDFMLCLAASRGTTFDATWRSVPPPVVPWRLPFNPAACENARDHMVLRWLELPRDEVSASPHREVLARQSRLVRDLHQEKR